MEPLLYQVLKVWGPDWAADARCGRIGASCPPLARGTKDPQEMMELTMSKRARKRRSRKGNAANHGRKPNA